MARKKAETAAPEAVQEKKVVTAPAKECLHPIEQAKDVERADGSGKWDRICGVPGCGFVMCEVGRPAALTITGQTDVVEEVLELKPCTHPPFSRNWKLVEDEVKGLICDCGADLGNRMAAPGKFMTADPEVEEAVQVAEASFSVAAQDPQDVLQEQEHETAQASPFADSPAPAEEAQEKREPFVPGEKSTSYITREPHRITPRFQELLPVGVDDEELGRFGQEMAEQFGTWRKTKLDAKKFAKACKEVTDRCEARMVELEEIIQDQARMEPVDVQWEYDYTAGEKVLRRCDLWTVVKRETLTIEERQLPMDLDGTSERAVEQLREIQKNMGADTAAVRSICAGCLGNCEEDGTPRDPSPAMTACTGFRDQLLEEQAQYRTGVCKDWDRCPLAVKCFGPANEQADNTDCLLHFPEFHHVKLQETDSALEELQALLAEVGLDVPMEILSAQNQEDLAAAWNYACAVTEEKEIPAMPLFLHAYNATAPAGELVGNGYPLHPGQVEGELQAVTEELDPLGAALAEG